MSSAVDKREWLRGQGFTVGERGRFSAEMKAAMAEAEKNGTVFVDKKAIVSTVAVIGEDGTITSERREVDLFGPTPDPIREGILTFVNDNGDKFKVNSTEVCISCMHSFPWCYCAVPTFRHWKTQEVYTLASTV